MARTKPIFTARLYDRRHLRQIASQMKAVQALYWDAIDTLCNRGERWLYVEPGKELHFEDFPMFNAEADKVVQNLARQLQLTIEQGNQDAWTLSNLKNDTMVKRMGFASLVPPEKLEQWTMPHMEALEQFNARVVKGMNLSERVWNLAQPFKSEMELALEIGIGDGLSAADLSRQVRRHLNEPNRLFRRVRDRDGNLRLSKAAQAYHPGRGVYRSSYKNALRMTATENNMAYRTADHQRWKQLDFVIGIEISTSPTNHPEPDICDELKGTYPKDFKFVGWHPWCRCIATAKTADDRQFDDYIDRMLAGEDVEGFHFEGEVTEMPECFTDWVQNNRERIAGARTAPYFIADNYVDGDPGKGFKWMQGLNNSRQATPAQSAPPTSSPIQPQTPARTARTRQQVQDIQDRWDLRRIEHNINLIPNKWKAEAQRAIVNKEAGEARRIMEEAAKHMEETLVYAIKYMKRSPIIKALVERLAETTSSGAPVLTGMDRIKHIQKLKEKCAVITRLDLRKCKATEGLVFDRIDTEWSMGGGTATISKTGVTMDIEEVRIDMIWFKDKKGKVFAYPIGATERSIEYKASKASEVISSCPAYIQNNIKGVVFVGQYHPLDKFYQIEYPNFRHGRAYSDDPITVHSKYYSKAGFKGMICHETGHHIDLKAGFRYSPTMIAEWTLAVAQDNGYPTPYAEDGGIVEDFAESMSAFVCGKRRFKKRFPYRAAIIEKIVRSIGGTP